MLKNLFLIICTFLDILKNLTENVLQESPTTPSYLHTPLQVELHPNRNAVFSGVGEFSCIQVAPEVKGYFNPFTPLQICSTMGFLIPTLAISPAVVQREKSPTSLPCCTTSHSFCPPYSPSLLNCLGWWQKIRQCKQEVPQSPSSALPERALQNVSGSSWQKNT